MKKQIFSTLVLSMCLLLPFSLYSQEQRKKVGVVLSGGGAKGMAHIKALKVIEEAGIPIDYIAGTSMGAIVGGLYAIGYTPEQLDSMVRKQNWTFLLSDRIKRSAMSLTDRERSEKFIVSIPFTKSPKDAASSGGIIKGQNLANLFSDLTMGYHDSINFDKLPIPFACVAANVVNGEQIIFHNGILSTAMRASMAIPGVFTPVRQDSMVLVDGGIVNNYPADVVKAMGADVIIGVDVQNALKKADKLPLIFLTVFLVIEADRFPFPVEFVFNQLGPLVVEALLLATYGRLILFFELVDGSRFGIGRRAGRVFQQLGLLRHGSQFRPLLCEELQKCPEVAIEFLLYLIDNLFSSFVLPDLFKNPFLPVRNTFFCI